MTKSEEIASLNTSIRHMYTVLEKLAIQQSVTVQVEDTQITYRSPEQVMKNINRMKSMKTSLLGGRQIRVAQAGIRRRRGSY